MDEDLISALVDRANGFGRGTTAYNAAVADLVAWREEAYTQMRAAGGNAIFITSTSMNGKTTSGIPNLTNKQVVAVTQQAINTLTGPNRRVAYADFSRITDR